MIERGSIREHMQVIDVDGEPVGRVDGVEGDRIKLTRNSAPDGEHHYVSLSDVGRVDEHVHLRIGKAGILGGAAAAAGAAGAAHAAGHGGSDGSPVPPLTNPAVPNAPPRKNFMLPWVLLGLALLALILALSQCGRDGEEERAAAVARDQANQNAAAAGGGALGPASFVRGSLAYDVNQHLLSKARGEKTFTFGNLNFDSGSARIRDAEQSDIAQLAEVLKANPGTRAAVVGYADARGEDGDNARLGADRALAVIEALRERGVDVGAIQARTGGELNPRAGNESAVGQAENRRTEFILLGRE